MNIFVLLKQVPDTESKIVLNSGKNGIEPANIKWVINPYDEFAVEEAIKTREKLKTGTVTVITVGTDRAIEALRTAVAMGADNAILVKSETDSLDGFLVARALAETLKKDKPDLILTGKQAIDDDQAVVFGYVAELLDLPSASVVVKMDLAADGKSVRVEREVDGGARHLIEMPIPAVVAVNKGINTPRYASLPGIMKAKKKEIKTYMLAELGLAGEEAKLKDFDFELPPERKAGKKLTGDLPTQIQELVRLLREEAKVI